MGADLTAILARLEAVEKLTREIAPKVEKTVACDRCSSVVDYTVVRENGPVVMERTEAGETTRAVVCNECIPPAKRLGWRLAMSIPAEPTKEEEAADAHR
jgi:hypothetical protein